MGDCTNKRYKEPFISIIIPFYNVGNYAEHCMKSLVGQHYTNCEFICVDDGSTDNTREILEKYSNDVRVKIVHKKNGGLSDARNYGLDIAQGDFISFIDGDDYVHPQYVEFLVNALDDQSNNIVISPLRLVKYSEPMDIQSGWANGVTHTVIDKREAFEKILYDELSASACGKLIPKKDYTEIRFPVGKVSEEVATIGSIIKKCDKCSIIDKPLYGYVMRSDSIGHKKEIKYEEIQNRIDAMEQLDIEIKQEYDLQNDVDLKNALQYRWGLRFVDMATMYDKVLDDKVAIDKTKHDVSKWLKTNIMQIIRNRRAPFAQRMRMLLYTYLPRMYNFLYTVRQRLKYNV